MVDIEEAANNNVSSSGWKNMKRGEEQLPNACEEHETICSFFLFFDTLLVHSLLPKCRTSFFLPVTTRCFPGSLQVCCRKDKRHLHHLCSLWLEFHYSRDQISREVKGYRSYHLHLIYPMTRYKSTVADM